MKITHNKVGQNVSIRDTQRGDKADAAKSVGAKSIADAAGAERVKDIADLGASKVDVSKRAQDMKKAKEIAMAAPDVDEAKVARLQKLIDEGNYKVDAEAVAERMIADHSSWE